VRADPRTTEGQAETGKGTGVEIEASIAAINHEEAVAHELTREVGIALINSMSKASDDVDEASRGSAKLSTNHRFDH
jgi:hypothetical protein